MKAIFTDSCTPRTWITFALAWVALLAAPAFLSAEEVTTVANIEVQNSALTDEAGLPTLAFASSKPNNLECDSCNCVELPTPPTTRVGATCLRARQNAAAAARTFANCPSGTQKCGPTTHSVAPCQALPTGGFSATAVARYHCRFCINTCH